MALRYPPDDPREWLNRASSSFLLAKQKAPRVLMEDLCVAMHACAEKAVKAIYVLQGEPAPSPDQRSLDDLLHGLAARGLDVSRPRAHAALLARFGPGAEYPSDVAAITDDEYEKALDAAHEILDWARAAVHAVPAFA